MSDKTSDFRFLELIEISGDENLGRFLFTDNANTLTVLQMCLDKNVQHFVQRSNINHQKEISAAISMDSDPSGFFSYPLCTIFGIANADKRAEVELRKISFEVSNPYDKESLLGKIEEYVQSLTKASSLMHEVLNTADELFTNAIYNAPYVDYSNDKSGVERDLHRVTIEESKRPCVFIGHDHERIILGCSDKFGTLNVGKLLSRIKKCYENDLANVINYSSGGAGIGAFMIFESSSSVYIGVKQGAQTQICCSFAYKLSSVSRSQLPKNLHIYSG